MNLSKNKINIIVIVALVVLCGGSFIGVRSLSKGLDSETTVPTSYAVESTTAPTTAAPVITEPITVTVPTSTSALNTITTFAIGTTVPTTIAPVTTTAPTTTAPTTTAPTTTAAPTTTKPATTKATTTKATTTTKADSSSSENGAIFDEGLAGYKYSSNGNYYYTSSDPWQRQFGYNELFDIGAGFVSIYMDTMRCKFEYDNRDWMIQFWKGQYGLVFVGHEVGVYTKPKDRTSEHYDAASNEDALYMELYGYRDGEELYHRDYGKYWWCTGFVPGTLDNLTDRSELSLDVRITMKDREMLNAFCDSLDGNGLVANKDYTIKGLDVSVKW